MSSSLSTSSSTLSPALVIWRWAVVRKRLTVERATSARWPSSTSTSAASTSAALPPPPFSCRWTTQRAAAIRLRAVVVADRLRLVAEQRGDAGDRLERDLLVPPALDRRELEHLGLRLLDRDLRAQVVHDLAELLHFLGQVVLEPAERAL